MERVGLEWCGSGSGAGGSGLLLSLVSLSGNWSSRSGRSNWLRDEVEMVEEEVDEEERDAGVVVADGLLLILMMPVKLKFFVNKSMME